MHLRTRYLAAAALACLATGASAKTLVYCSEGSPEGFDPGLYTAGTTFDAVSQPIFNRLVQFVQGTTTIEPGLAESWTVSEDGKEYTFKLRPGVKFQTTDFFTPTRELNADDVIFSFERQLNEDNPWHSYAEGTTWDYFVSMDMPSLIKEIRKDDDLTVTFVLNRPEAPFMADLAMDFASIVSKEYADSLEASGRQADFNQAPVGTGPFTVRRLPEGRGDPLQGQPGLLGRQAADRRPDLRHHRRHRRAHAEAQGRRVPDRGLSQPGGHRGPEGRPAT